MPPGSGEVGERAGIGMPSTSFRLKSSWPGGGRSPDWPAPAATYDPTPRSGLGGPRVSDPRRPALRDRCALQEIGVLPAERHSPRGEFGRGGARPRAPPPPGAPSRHPCAKKRGGDRRKEGGGGGGGGGGPPPPPPSV